MLIDRLYHDVMAKGPVCVGLDTQYDFLPASMKNGTDTDAEKILAFNRRVIDATHDVAGCYKVQVACYEALGISGMKAFAATVRYAREKGSVVISDVKRGDISSTAAQYAKGHFTGDFETDFITVNSYMGEDAVSPYYDYIKNKEKGVFLLVKTSNASGRDIQDLDNDGETVYMRMARLTARWGEQFMGICGFSSIGAVTGLTYPDEFAAMKMLMPHVFLLIPGYGAQGGTGKDIGAFFKGGVRGVVNSSRGLLKAHAGKTDKDDFDQYIRDAAILMREDILGSIEA